MKGVVFLADNHNGSTFERPLTIGPFLDKHFKLRTDEGGMPFCAFNFIASNKQSIIDMNKCVFERYKLIEFMNKHDFDTMLRYKTITVLTSKGKIVFREDIDRLYRPYKTTNNNDIIMEFKYNKGVLESINYLDKFGTTYQTIEIKYNTTRRQRWKIMSSLTRLMVFLGLREDPKYNESVTKRKTY